MAISQVTLGFPTGAKLFTDTDSEGTVVAISAAAATLYLVEVDNTGNAAASYVKLWNTAAAGVTIGTTAPDMIFFVAASVKRSFAIIDGAAFGTALSIATVTTAGTAGTTNPTSAVTVKAVYA